MTRRIPIKRFVSRSFKIVIRQEKLHGTPSRLSQRTLRATDIPMGVAAQSNRMTVVGVLSLLSRRRIGARASGVAWMQAVEQDENKFDTTD